MIFSAHLVAVKCEVFTTSSTTEIQLCARPATQLTHSPYFRQIAYASPLRMREDLSERGLYECWDNHQSSLEHEWSKSHSRNHPCVTLRCVCAVSLRELRIICFPKDRCGISIPVLPRASDQPFSGAENKAVFCVSPVPQELCRTVRCVYRVLQIPGTNRVCVYCASGFWWDIPVFSRCRRPATSPARSVRYRVSLCVPSSFGV